MASFDENGKYIKTNWKAGDRITATKLNKIEESIEAVNDNDISRHVEADARLDALEDGRTADKQELNAKVDALEDTVVSNKDATDLDIYRIDQHMTLLDKKIDDGVAEVYGVAETLTSTVNEKVTKTESDMQALEDDLNADMSLLDKKIDDGIAELEVHMDAVTNAINDELDVLNEHLNDIVNNGNKVMVLFSGTPTSGNTITLTPNGQTLNRIRTCNAGWLLGCAVTFAYKLIGSITFEIYRNGGAELLASLTCGDGYGGSLNLNHGEKHIYSDDLLMVKAVSGEITDSPGEVSLSLMFTQ